MIALIRNLKTIINSPYFTEESISDYLLYRLKRRNINVEKISRRREAMIGCDFIIEGKIAIQAKKLINGKYNIEYKNQKEVFYKYCKDNDMIGYYLFYNPNSKDCVTCLKINSSIIKKVKEIDGEIRNIHTQREMLSCVQC